MITVNARELFLHLNDFCTAAMQNAVGLAVSRSHYEITPAHLFLKLLETDRSDWSLVFPHFGLEPGAARQALMGELEEHPAGNTAKPALSPLLLELFQDAWLIASLNLGETRIRSGAILSAFLAKASFFGSGRLAELTGRIPRGALAEEFGQITRDSLETAAAVPSAGSDQPRGAAPADGFVAKYCQDFTRKASEGGIDPVFGRDEEIRRIVDILARRRKNNPICVGEPGVGKTAVVEGLARRIVEGDVPDLLKQVRLLGLDLGLLEAGAGVKGEYERRLKGVIDEIKGSEQPTILFIDEAHTLVGGGAASGAGDAANLLKPALARGELRTIAATTWREYKKYFEKDAALARRFQLVKLEEPSVEATILILRGIKEHYEAAHRVIVRDDAAVAAAEMSDRYISGRFLPDKAIDLLDTACARIKINLSAKPAALEDAERRVAARQREIEALKRDRAHGLPVEDEALQKLRDSQDAAAGEAECLGSQWQKELEAARRVVDLREALHAAPEDEIARRDLEAANRDLETLQARGGLLQIEVTPEVVARVVSDWTGIPLGKLRRDEAGVLVALKEHLGKRIRGQDQALEVIAESLQAAKAGIKNPLQPLGVFLLVGPSGVGKTETGLALADLLFGSEKHVITINMSEYQERHTVSRLVGSPPGYVGFGEGGLLTEAVRQRPYSVVLLDEAEKAHLDVMNLFYQVFDKGQMTDGEGKDINFRNTVLILTSNLAADVIQEMTAGPEPPREAVMSAIRPLLSGHFKPALLARMTVVPFYSLRPEIMREIVELKLQVVRRMLADNNRMELRYTPAVADHLAARCTEVETGARNIDHILNGTILPRLSRSLLEHLGGGEVPREVLLDLDSQGAVAVAFAGTQTGAQAGE
ncbi:MAG: type VI secretion system ATPase TssH [Candidatus Zixiibacteriota bacterium]|nr:MAG: type VI secretion system ATPase TssH [candidate division Zixibacteria bacterium]